MVAHSVVITVIMFAECPLTRLRKIRAGKSQYYFLTRPSRGNDKAYIASNSPTRRDADRQRRMAERSGEELRGKRDSPKRPMGLCKRDIKISLQIASTTFPFRSRSAYRIETRETDCLRFVSLFLRRRPFVSILRTFDSTGWKRDFSTIVALLRLQIDSIVANIVPLAIVMIIDVLSWTYIEMFVDKRHPIMLPR